MEFRDEAALLERLARMEVENAELRARVPENSEAVMRRIQEENEELRREVRELREALAEERAAARPARGVPWPFGLGRVVEVLRRKR